MPSGMAEKTKKHHISLHQLLKVVQNFSSVQLSRLVMSDSLQPHGLQHARLPVLHHLLEFAQTHVHRVSGAIQLSRPLWSPSPAFNLS